MAERWETRPSDPVHAGGPPGVSGVNDVVQRPNAIGSAGGPYLLRGLMLPLPPSKNAATRSLPMVKAGTKYPLTLTSFRHMMSIVRAITYPTDVYKDYAKLIREQALDRGFAFGVDCDLWIDIVVCPRDRREVDAHNYHMVLVDALQDAGVYEDDKQIKRITCTLGPIIPKGRVVVSLERYFHQAQAELDRAWSRAIPQSRPLPETPF